MPSDDYSIGKHRLSSAITAEDEGKYAEARKQYAIAVVHFDNTLKSNTDSTTTNRAKAYQTNALERIKFIDENKKIPSGGAPGSSFLKKVARILPSKETLMKSLKNVQDSAVERVLKEVLEDCSHISLEDVAGNERAKQLLNEAVILPTLRPELFTGLRSPVRGVLLFGPPGNGKTLLAKAISSESNCTFFNISAASLLSKWVGESESMVRALFAVARQVQPAIIFLDEVDSLLSARREDSGNEVSRRVLTQFLAEMDGVSSGSERVLVLAATNRPAELDDAALRRFPRRVYVRMPDARTRLELLHKLLANHAEQKLSESDLKRIATLTEGYSASDLKELAKEAAIQPIREINAADLRTISAKKVRPIKLNDFVLSLQTVRTSVAPASLTPYEQWNQQFGEGASNVPTASAASSRNSPATGARSMLNQMLGPLGGAR